MSLIADGLLVITALTTCVYCIVLSRRLRRLGSAGDGIGQKIHALTASVEETRSALSETQSRMDGMRREAQSSTETFARESARAKRLADDLAAAVAAAERTLDGLYRAERALAGSAHAASIAEEPPGLEILDEVAARAVAEDGAPEDQPETAKPEVGAIGKASLWSGGDVLKVERMFL